MQHIEVIALAIASPLTSFLSEGIAIQLLTHSAQHTEHNSCS